MDSLQRVTLRDGAGTAKLGRRRDYCAWVTAGRLGSLDGFTRQLSFG